MFIAVAVAFATLLMVGVGLTLFNPGGDQPGGTVATPRPTASAAGRTPASAPTEGTADRVRTTTESCPAADVAGAGAACVAEPECWSGIVQLLGEVQINRVGCEDRHVWETFAVAPLPEGGVTWNAEQLERHPVVKRLCSRQVLLASRTGGARRIADGRWLIAVVPPTKQALADGARTFRCVGAVTGADDPGSRFRP